MLQSNLFLLLAAAIWGFGFVAQRLGLFGRGPRQVIPHRQDAFADTLDDTGTQESAATRVAPTPFFELEDAPVAAAASVDVDLPRTLKAGRSSLFCPSPSTMARTSKTATGRE